jgi:TonB family protein
MKLVQALIAGTLAAALAPVAEAAPAASVPRWESGRFENSADCFVAREDQGGGILVLIADARARLWVAAGQRAWKAEEGETYQVGLEIDGKPRPVKAGFGVRSMGLTGFLVQVNRGFIREVRRGRTLRVSPPGAPPMTVSLEGGADAAAGLMRCYNFPRGATSQSSGGGLLAEVPLRDPFRRDRAFPRRAVGVFADIITSHDYPAEAVRNREQGQVAYRLETGADSRITGCSIVRSSGSATLDSATCALFVRRGRVRPALDAEGKPVPDTFLGTLEWKLAK